MSTGMLYHPQRPWKRIANKIFIRNLQTANPHSLSPPTVSVLGPAYSRPEHNLHPPFLRLYEIPPPPVRPFA
jgi:hypothetical protein